MGGTCRSRQGSVEWVGVPQIAPLLRAHARPLTHSAVYGTGHFGSKNAVVCGIGYFGSKNEVVCGIGHNGPQNAALAVGWYGQVAIDDGSHGLVHAQSTVPTVRPWPRPFPSAGLVAWGRCLVAHACACDCAQATWVTFAEGGVGWRAIP